MGSQVIVFFAFVTLCVLASAYLLPRFAQSIAARRFALGLWLVGIAFAIWSVVVITKPVDTLETFVTTGLIVMLGALVLIVNAATIHLSRSEQQLALVLTVAYMVLLVVIRFFNPSQPFFSDNGLFYFGQQPVVGFMTILMLGGTIVPAVLVVAREIKDKDVLSSNVFIGACMAELIGGVLLLSSRDDSLLTLVGWAMGIAFAFLVLASAGVFGRLSPRRS
jgi:hypothetical protein